MFVGAAGTGKSVIITNRLEKLNADNFMVSTVPLNCKQSYRVDTDEGVPSCLR